MNKEKDIFDKIMSLPGIRVFEPIYIKYKEVLLYLFFGGLAFVVSIASFAFFDKGVGLNEHISNLLSWIFAVTFAYLTNRVWVFDAKTNGFIELIKQIFSFFAGRVVTLIIEELILLVFITWLRFDSLLIKIIAQIVVIILNYVISKLFVFNNK